MQISFPRRYFFLVRLSLSFFFIQFLVRVILCFEKSPSTFGLLKVLGRGILWDGLCWSVLSFPVFVISALVSERFFSTCRRFRLEEVVTFAGVFALTFVGFCELTFWDEFHSRFNFIAVDYLVYTNEVLANLVESFPMHVILPAIASVAGLLTVILFKMPLRQAPLHLAVSRRAQTVFLLLPLFFVMGLGPLLEDAESRFREDQLSRNGWVEFYRAFRSNQIDYDNFYATVPLLKAETTVKQKLSATESFSGQIPDKPNVVIVVVESLGAKFIGPLGAKDATITPFLNALADRSMFFENLFSTGTRTVRGLEAINLSIPPTPGYAVVKRANHRNLYSLGNTFLRNGYEPIFLYGGRGFFDNMNSFFEGNGFQTLDQSSFSKKEKTFTNAWGVCDEDLFRKALSVMDAPSSKPKLLFMLTTSNHRPFTYPDGKIDIPSGTSRAGAVKYTDFAIGKFIEEAQMKSWAKKTLFVIVADHSTEGRGRFDLDMADFHIPMWIYSPNYIKPQRLQRLVSQIDLLPSLIHLLGLKDQSPFFGKSVFAKNFEERAFIGNYQYVGYYRDNTLTTLGPNRNVRTFTYDLIKKKQKNSDNLTYKDEAISYYQFASHLLKTGKYNFIPRGDRTAER